MKRTQNLTMPALPAKLANLSQQSTLAILAGLALIANLLILAGLPLMWEAGVILLLTGLLPGWLFVDWLLGGPGRTLPEPWERTLYAVAAGCAIIVITLLLLSYIPGPLAWQHALLAFDLILLLLFGLLWRRGRAAPPAEPPDETQADDAWPDILAPSRPQASGWLIAGVISLALVGGALRFTDLAYTEFQGDEARAVLRAAEAIQGYHDALLTHKKGPVEILLPTDIYLLAGRINEATVRLPFALINLAGLFAVFLLGWRLYHPVAGWAAAMLLALDGYFIGFARIVQYQSIVFLMVVLVALILYRLVRRPQDLARYLTLAAIFLATGLLAHYEAALVALPGAYLLYALWRRHPAVNLARLGRALIAPVLAGGALLAVFYVPFVLNPSFRITYAYITVNRIGSTFPYNNLVDVFERTTLYSSVYYVALLVLCAVLSLAAIYRRSLPRVWGWVAAALLAAGVLVTLWQPAWIVIRGHDHTWAFYAAALVIAWFLPDFPLEQRLAWLWFGSGAIFMLFFTLTPNTHVYGFFIPWALVAGEAIGRGWLWLRHRLGARPAARIAAITAALAVLVFGNYVYWYFAATDLEVLRTWRENRPRGYPVTYDMPTRMSIFGFPLKNGWKAVGALYADGVLDAPFEVHGKEPVADWYTRGAGYCPRDHVYYIWHESVEPADLGYNTVVREQIEADGYQLFGTVLVNEQPRLRIYTSDGAPVAPQTYRVEDFEQRFDRDLSGPVFELDGPSAASHMQHELDLRLGDGIRLRGYSLDRTEAKPGEGVLLTLYWQADQPLETAYSVFTQIIDMTDYHKAGQRDGEPVCNQLPSDFWLPGDTIVDRYYIPIFADAPPGVYRLLVGMYDSETGDRLDIFAPDGAHLGDAFGLADITVTPP